jgi:hypothetical protein
MDSVEFNDGLLFVTIFLLHMCICTYVSTCVHGSRRSLDITVLLLELV